MIVILDCNIWLSLALNQQLIFIDRLSTKHRIVIATCNELIAEVTNVASRPKFRKYFTLEYLQNLIIFHQATTKPFQLKHIPHVVTDEKDNYLFALCAISKADYFVTGDKLLLDVKNYQTTQIISLSEFKLIIK